MGRSFFMDSRQRGTYIANETLNIFKQGFYRVRRGTVKVKDLEDFTVKNTVLYTPENTEELIKKINITTNSNCIIEVTTESTLTASKRLLDEGYKDVACLNFASAKHPGGGFLSGSFAQEESLARASGLYPSIALKKEMYDYNAKLSSPLYSDYMIYSPKVPVIRDDDFNLLDMPYCISMITSPSVNYGAIRDKSELAQVESVMRKRIEKILAYVRGLEGKGSQLEDSEDYVKEHCPYIDAQAFSSFMETARKARYGRDKITSDEFLQVQNFHNNLYGRINDELTLVKRIFFRIFLFV
jgi:uncharacterized protein (TIGR02452 family)